MISHLNPCCLSVLRFHHHHSLSGLFQDPSNKDPYIPNPLTQRHPLCSYQILTKLCLSSLLASNLSTDIQSLHDKVPIPSGNKALHNSACFFSVFCHRYLQKPHSRQTELCIEVRVSSILLNTLFSHDA